eukprot:2262636-Rhodomonas_salina.1
MAPKTATVRSSARCLLTTSLALLRVQRAARQGRDSDPSFVSTNWGLSGHHALLLVKLVEKLHADREQHQVLHPFQRRPLPLQNLLAPIHVT